MPVISRFFGILITMYHREHGPPHFHATYGGRRVAVDIATGVIRGEIPPRAAVLVNEWWRLHQRELEDNWERAQRLDPLVEIEPLS